jgi:uncharacterized membrane protein (DUF2068 family)
MARTSAKPKPRPKKGAKRTGSFTLLLIALFKLLKGFLLLAVAIGALRLLHKDIAETIEHWVRILRVDSENRYIHRLLEKLFAVTPKQLKELSAGTFIYSGLLLTEGVGLLMRKRWAEYFTVITTAGLIPLEVYELAKHFTAGKVAVLVVNVLIVWYLVARLQKERHT